MILPVSQIKEASLKGADYVLLLQVMFIENTIESTVTVLTVESREFGMDSVKQNDVCPGLGTSLSLSV